MGRPKGTPNTWTPQRKAEAFARICEQTSLGKSLRSICSAPDMPHIETARDWISGDETYGRQYARAREAQADFYAEEIIEIVDTATDANIARTRMEARKWLASKIMPKRYGDKIAHVGGDENDNPIRYTDEADAFTRRIAGIAPRIGTGSGAGETEH